MADIIHDNPANRQEDSDEIGVARGLRKKKSSFSFKGLATVLMIAALVIVSFWLSFLIGKRILSPMRQVPKAEPQKTETYRVPEDLPVYAAPAPKEKAGPDEAVPEVKQVKKVVIKKDPFFAAKKKTAATVNKGSGSLYKVRTSIAESKEKAFEIMKGLKEKGFDEAFAHELGGGKFSVQAGAFKLKANAEKLIKELKEKGFDGKIITDE